MNSAKIKIVFYFKTGKNSFRKIEGNTNEIIKLSQKLTADHAHWAYRKDCVNNDPSVGVQFWISEIFMNLMKKYNIIKTFYTDFSQREINNEYHSIPSFTKGYDPSTDIYFVTIKFQKQGDFSVVYNITTDLNRTQFESQFLNKANLIENQFRELFQNEIQVNYPYYKAKFSGWIEPINLLLKIAPDKFLIDEFDFRHLEILEFSQTQPGPEPPEPEPPGNGESGNGESSPGPTPELPNLKQIPAWIWILIAFFLIIFIFKR